jgi:hypothetical protein
VARTILDLAGAGLPQHRLGRLIDDAVLSKKTTVVLLQSILSRSRRRGVRGVQAVDRALQPWLNGGVESHAEAQVLRLLLAAGFRAPVCQHEIRDGAVFVARVDFAWPAQRVVLEVDGFQYNDGPPKFVEDRPSRELPGSARIVGHHHDASRAAKRPGGGVHGACGCARWAQIGAEPGRRRSVRNPEHSCATGPV